MTAAIVQTVVATTTSTAAASLSAAITPASGNLLVAYLTITLATGTVTFTVGDVVWSFINEIPSSGTVVQVSAWSAIPTASTAVSVDVTYTGSGGTGGKAALTVSEFTLHNGVGVSTIGTVAGASTLISVPLVTTSANAAILTSHGAPNATLEGNLPTGYSSLAGDSVLGAGNDFSYQLAGTSDGGAAGTHTVQWGANPGTSIPGGRRVIAIEIIPAATVSFNYNLLEHRVMRGAGRAVMRGVA